MTGCCPSTTPLTALAEGWVWTDSRAGAPAVAVALNSTTPMPETTALTVLLLTPGAPPSVQAAVACPAASVVEVAGVTLRRPRR